MTVDTGGSRPPNVDRRTPLLLALAAPIGVLAAVISYAIDRIVVHLGDPEGLLLWWNNAIVGVLSFIVALVILIVVARARRAERLRFEVIREVNHHVGNALQVVRLHQSIEGDPEMTAQVDDAIDRIEWVLGEVLPQVNASDAVSPSVAGRFPWRRPRGGGSQEAP
ncbi:MAG: hypothetical protein O3B31_03430 [Chloroflexi bacterium]|nr:hypothetical protein [Chloroflexota bacterium]MDA1002391.1 hypothetical protein [Chloroflexota bacterium]